MKRSTRIAYGVAFVLAGIAACQTSPPAPPGLPGTGMGRDTATLVESLTAVGFGFKPSQYPPVPAPHLHAPVTEVDAGDESLAIWEYPNADAAAGDARRISPRGVDGGFMELGSDARWFRRDRLLVLYLGTDRRMQTALSETLGPPFVGPTNDLGERLDGPGASKDRR